MTDEQTENAREAVRTMFDRLARVLEAAESPEDLAVMVVTIDDLLSEFRSQALVPAKARLGEALSTREDGNRFVVIDDRIVEPGWTSARRTWDGDALASAVSTFAPDHRVLNSDGEVESPADAVARVFTECFPTNKPRIRAVERYVPEAKRRYSTVDGTGHHTISVRRPGASQRRSNDDE